MNPLQAFLDFIAQLKAQANATLKGLPPFEQFDASQELSYCFRSLQNQANSLIEFAENSTKTLTGMVESIKTAATAEAKTVLIASGDYVTKADHEAAVTAGKLAKETEVREAVQAEAAAAVKLTERRKNLVDTKVLPAIAAERLPDAVLKGDDYLTLAGKVSLRLKQFSDIGITAEVAPTVIGEVASMPLDEAGDAALNLRLKFCQEAGAKKPAAKGAVGNPLAAGAAAATAETAATDSPVRRNLL